MITNEYVTRWRVVCTAEEDCDSAAVTFAGPGQRAPVPPGWFTTDGRDRLCPTHRPRPRPQSGLHGRHWRRPWTARDWRVLSRWVDEQLLRLAEACVLLGSLGVVGMALSVVAVAVSNPWWPLWMLMSAVMLFALLVIMRVRVVVAATLRRPPAEIDKLAGLAQIVGLVGEDTTDLTDWPDRDPDPPRHGYRPGVVPAAPFVLHRMVSAR